MKNNELIERYVYAVTRRLPIKMRDDIEKEINGLIGDMLEERCGDMTPTETDVKVVLTELGAPDELAAKYDPNGERSLIGPKYFPTYWRVLTITLAAGTAGMIIAAVLAVLTGESTGAWYEIIAEWLSNIWNTALAVFATITAVFAIMEYKKVDINLDEDLMKLPSVPKEKEKISRADCIVGIVFSVVLLALFLFAPQVFCGGSITTGENGTSSNLFPIFNVDYIHSVWYLFVIAFVAEIARECYMLVIGRYNFPVAIVSAVTSAVNIIASGFILLSNKLVSPELQTMVHDAVLLDGGDAVLAERISSSFGAIIFAIVFLTGVAGVVKCFLKAAVYKAD